MVAVPPGATQAELDAHAADTTSVHGIADTSVLELTSNKAVASGYAGLDGNVFVPAAQLARYRAGPIAVGPSDASEVTLINQTIPASLLGTTGAVRCSIVANFLNNHASNQRTVTLRVYAGGTKIYDCASSGQSASPNRRAVTSIMHFVNAGATNANELSGFFDLGNVTAPTTGVSSLVTTSPTGRLSSGRVAIDTSVAWVFKVTLQLSASESTLECPVALSLLEVL